MGPYYVGLLETESQVCLRFVVWFLCCIKHPYSSSPFSGRLFKSLNYKIASAKFGNNFSRQCEVRTRTLYLKKLNLLPGATRKSLLSSLETDFFMQVEAKIIVDILSELVSEKNLIK